MRKAPKLPTNVVSLRLVRNARPAPRQDLIEALERLLSKARSGDLQGMAFISVTNDSYCEADVKGLCIEHPLYSIGLCRALETELLKRR